jgi:hypothetical protein
MTVEEALRLLKGAYGESYEVFEAKAREVLEAVRAEAYADGVGAGEYPDDE